MSIGNELSCDVAAAMLVSKEERAERKDLTEVVLEFHSALRQLDGEERRRRRAQILQNVPANAGAASGGH